MKCIDFDDKMDLIVLLSAIFFIYRSIVIYVHVSQKITEEICTFVYSKAIAMNFSKIKFLRCLKISNNLGEVNIKISVKFIQIEFI